MWNLASSCIAGILGLKNDKSKPKQKLINRTDDEISSLTSQEEGLECPICWESFNLVENVPYVLWCGHTLCKNCVLGLQLAVVKIPTLPLQLPLLISCPWCNLLSPRLIYRGMLKFPRKNFFLLWMLESMNGDRVNSHCGDDCRSSKETAGRCMNERRAHIGYCSEASGSGVDHDQFSSYHVIERLHLTIRKSLVFFVQLMTKFPLIVIFLLILLYVVPASATVLALYVLITVVFALPSLLILYFAYPCLDWLMREIVS